MPTPAWRGLAEVVAERARQHGLIGHARHAHYRAAERHLAAGRNAEAMQQIVQARSLCHWRFADHEAPEPVHPAAISSFEVELIELQVAQALAEPTFPDQAAAVAKRLRQVAQNAVPTSFRDGFLQRQPIHRAVLALAARLSGAG